jgi:hypothetical protein
MRKPLTQRAIENRVAGSVGELGEDDPNNADNELRALVDAAHNLGLYIILDIVLNHVGDVRCCQTEKYWWPEAQSNRTRAISLSLKVLPYQPRPARNQFQVRNSVRPMHLFGHTFDHDY